MKQFYCHALSISTIPNFYHTFTIHTITSPPPSLQGIIGDTCYQQTNRLLCYLSLFRHRPTMSSGNPSKGDRGGRSAPPPPVPADQMRALGSGRRKVALPPGRSQLDWIRTSNAMIPTRPRTITLKELRQHKRRENAWMAINGSVYNVAPYVEFHPGGINMILAGAGKDATKLFEKYHSWVNPNFMLKNQFLGMLDDEEGDDDDDDDDDDVDDDDDDDNQTTTATS